MTEAGRARAARWLAIGALVAASACTRQPEMAPVGVSDKAGAALPERPVSYAFDTLDERPVSSEAMAGKPTLIVFVTTGDLIGQAQVDFIVAMEKNDGKDVNYALVALHPRKEIVLVEAYMSTLKVEFPVALGDPASTTPSGPFGEIPAVPTVVILDRFSKIVWKHTGLAKADELRGHMRGL